MRRITVSFIVNPASFVVLLGLSVSGIIIALPHEHGPNEAKGPLGGNGAIFISGLG